jgi:cell division protein FtsW
MATIFKRIQGDRTLWVIALILALFSLLPVYSASSNIAYTYGSGDTFSMLTKHGIHLVLGLLLMFAVHNMNYKHFGAIAVIMLPVAVILLIYTYFGGINTSNATRWIRVPVLGFTFQTSALASVVLIMYLARNLAKIDPVDLKSFKRSFTKLLLPILLICGFILPSNFSTAALLFAMSMIMLFIGGYALKNLFYLLGSGIVALTLFIVLVMSFPNISNRVATWKARIEAFVDPAEADNYQVHKAKMAIAQGMVLGKGPGKSVQKNFLPQSNSDFIYAVIVEEFGLIGGFFILAFYIFFFIRVLIIATNAQSNFGMLAAFGAGLVVMVQALINLGVAVNLLPVTGQTLPLISAGGSSIWMTCISIGIVLSVSKGKQEAISEEPEIDQAEVPPLNELAHA